MSDFSAVRETHLRALGDLPAHIAATADENAAEDRVLDLLQTLEASISQVRAKRGEITHACPPDGFGLTPCCGKTPFELPRTDRITVHDHMVTCGVDL